MRRLANCLIPLLLISSSLTLFAANTKPASKQGSASDPRLAGAFRQPAEHGWTYVHLAGTPSQIGFQHGYLLAPRSTTRCVPKKLSCRTTTRRTGNSSATPHRT